MFFLFIKKTLRLNESKTKTVMNAETSVFGICVEVIIYLPFVLYNLHDYCTFNQESLINLDCQPMFILKATQWEVHLRSYVLKINHSN